MAIVVAYRHYYYWLRTTITTTTSSTYILDDDDDDEVKHRGKNKSEMGERKGKSGTAWIYSQLLVSAKNRKYTGTAVRKVFNIPAKQHTTVVRTYNVSLCSYSHGMVAREKETNWQVLFATTTTTINYYTTAAATTCPQNKKIIERICPMKPKGTLHISVRGQNL